MSAARRYRSDGGANQVVALSISYQRENLLARGLGLEHLREMLIRLARPLLRQEVSLAYGGNWQETEDNFTYELLRLISAEQADDIAIAPSAAVSKSKGNKDAVPREGCLGRLFNHSAWPSYLAITPGIEAKWINCCRIVRITQEKAGLKGAEILPDGEAEKRTDHAIFNSAVTLSAMRRLSMETMELHFPEVPNTEKIPKAVARVSLGGKIQGYVGFLPGIFEEALLTLERERPLYILGGFGGAAEVLSRALLDSAPEPPPELTEAWQIARNPDLARLQQWCAKGHVRLPSDMRGTGDALATLWDRIRAARSDLPKKLHTGLTEEETRELLMTRDMARAVKLIRKGLEATIHLIALPA